jgi:hypothetical protein
MKRFFASAGPLFMSLGLALLICSLILAPANQALAQGGPPGGCPGVSCDGGCYSCDPTVQLACNYMQYKQCYCNQINVSMPQCTICECKSAPISQCTCQ